MTSSSSLPQRYVCPWILRRLFNESNITERAEREEVRVTYRKLPRRAPASAGQAPGAVTELLEYFLPDGTSIALAHQYRNPDGTIGASGRPDPKLLRTDVEILIPYPEADHSCPDCPPRR